eukprot:733088_1
MAHQWTRQWMIHEYRKYETFTSKKKSQPRSLLTRTIGQSFSESATNDSHPIPHVIHQMWKTTRVSGKFADFVKTALATHPDFKYVFWTDQDCRALVRSAGTQRLRDRLDLQSGVRLADVCRTLILFEFGGVYADIDTLFVKDLSPLIDKHQFVSGWEPPEHHSDHSNRLFNLAFLASQPGHPLLAKILDHATEHKFSSQWDHIVGHLADLYEKYDGPIPATMLSSEYFCPLTDESRNMYQGNEAADAEMLRKSITDHTYTVHMWGCSWCLEKEGVFGQMGGFVDIRKVVGDRLQFGADLI